MFIRRVIQMNKVGQKGNISLARIAKRFNVNISTASRALSGDPRISVEMKDKIIKYAASVNYKPSPLRRARKQAIGLMIYGNVPGKMDDFYQREVLQTATMQLSNKGYHVHLELLEREVTSWPAFISECRVDGVIVSGHPPVEVCAKLRKEGMPAVIFGDTLERTGCFCVRPDPFDGTIQTVKKLVELGHRDIAYVSSSTEYPTVEQRYKAFCFGMFDNKSTPNPDWVVLGLESNSRGGRIGVRKILDSGKIPSAIVFINDQMALGGMMELLARGFKLPSDMSIVGYDNTSICEEIEPALSSVDMSFEVLVAESIELLRMQIEDGFNNPVEKVMKTHLLVRDSLAKAKA